MDFIPAARQLGAGGGNIRVGGPRPLLWSVVLSGGLSTYGSAGLLLGIIYAYVLIYSAIRFTLEVLWVG